MEDSPEYLAARQQFYDYYDNVVTPSLREIEKKRHHYLGGLIAVILLVVLWIALLLTGKVSFLGEGENGFIFCLLVLCVCTPIFMYYKKSKESILPLLIGFFGKFNYTYHPNLPLSVLNQSQIMKKSDDIASDDGFTGEYKEVPVSIMEYARFKYQEQKEDGVRKIKRKVKGRGIIFEAEMKKKFDGHTIVVKDKGMLNKFSRYKGLERAGLESPEFEKAFEVYTDNQIEARYILTAVMIEYMLELKKLFPNAEYSFVNNNVLINIEIKKNMFECSNFFRSVINKKRAEKHFKQFYLLFSIIEILHLNQKQML